MHEKTWLTRKSYGLVDGFVLNKDLCQFDRASFLRLVTIVTRSMVVLATTRAVSMRVLFSFVAQAFKTGRERASGVGTGSLMDREIDWFLSI